MVPVVGGSRVLFHEGTGPFVRSPESWGEPFPHSPLFDSIHQKTKKIGRITDHFLVPVVGIEPTWSCPRRILRAKQMTSV